MFANSQLGQFRGAKIFIIWVYWVCKFSVFNVRLYACQILGYLFCTKYTNVGRSYWYYSRVACFRNRIGPRYCRNAIKIIATLLSRECCRMQNTSTRTNLFNCTHRVYNAIICSWIAGAWRCPIVDAKCLSMIFCPIFVKIT